MNKVQYWGQSEMDAIHRLINRKKYRGIGRPRKSDYEYKTIGQIQREVNQELNKHLDRIINE